jgi:hypothetical protein
MAAATQVFDTTELLEIILYELPTKDLLFAQRISKQTKAVIDNSTKLQQALFFKPVPADSKIYQNGKCIAKTEVLKNPLLEPGHKCLMIVSIEPAR